MIGNMAVRYAAHDTPGCTRYTLAGKNDSWHIYARTTCAMEYAIVGYTRHEGHGLYHLGHLNLPSMSRERRDIQIRLNASDWDNMYPNVPQIGEDLRT